jgi:hypothetical protein
MNRLGARFAIADLHGQTRTAAPIIPFAPSQCCYNSEGLPLSLSAFQKLERFQDNVRGERSLVTMAWNVKRMFALKAA